MKIVVIGAGHVGLVTACSLAHLGHEVVAYDDDLAKVERLERGEAPFFEPGLSELLATQVASGRLRFARSSSDAVPGMDVAFICVGTPSMPDGEANLQAVESAASEVGKQATADMVVVQKSTVPVATSDRVAETLGRVSEHRFWVVSNPEFLREGSAVLDSIKPQRILVGCDDSEGHRRMREVYAPLIDSVKYFETDVRTAELAKHACNAFLALKISYANALARICEASGADVVAIADIMGSDPRIGREFLNAGLGYGGYCFPKDVAAFKTQATKLGYEFGLLDEVIKINRGALDATFAKIKDALWNLEDKKILVLGLAFKGGTDDVRESPALALAEELIGAGAKVVGFDPVAGPAAAASVAELGLTNDIYEGALEAHCLVIATDWPEFVEIDLVRLKGVMTHPIIVDARNLLSPLAAQEAGFTYIPTGRPPVNL